jgi:hypothetical protein
VETDSRKQEEMKKVPLYSRPDITALPRITGLYALVDDADFHRVTSAARWWLVSFDRNGKPRYPSAQVDGPEGKRVRAVLHRFILNAPAGTLVDHKDRDVLNCQRKNLRYCNRAQNAMNTSARPQRKSCPYRGVVPVGKRWVAVLWANRKRHQTKGFTTPEEAARAYDALAVEHHGEFAVLNFGVAS